MTGDDHAPAASAKRRLGKASPALAEEDLATIRKPGLETSYPHIAMMWIGKDNETALSLTRDLTRSAAERLGIRRKGRY
jgi:hypothetical protein